MPRRRPSSSTLATFVTAAAITLAAGMPVSAATPDAGAQIARASSLIESGKLVVAKHELEEIAERSLSPAQRERVNQLLASTERRLRFTDVVDISLQKATLALELGDLRQAERQAQAASRARTATAGQKDAALELLDTTRERRAEVAPAIPTALEQAVADFQREDYAAAKAGFEAVYRSGVELSPEQLRTLTRHRSRLAALEIERGADFSGDVASAGLLQPGRVRERNQNQQEDPQQEPETVEAQTPQDQPAPDDGDAFQEALEFEAARVIAEADRAFQEGRYNEAFDKYAEIAGPLRDYASPEAVERARERMPEIRVLLGQAGGGILETELERRQLVVEQARAEFDNLIEQARAALAAGETETARQRASEARLRLTEAREFLAQDEFDARLETQRQLLREIASQEEASASARPPSARPSSAPRPPSARPVWSASARRRSSSRSTASARSRWSRSTRRRSRSSTSCSSSTRTTPPACCSRTSCRTPSSTASSTSSSARRISATRRSPCACRTR